MTAAMVAAAAAAALALVLVLVLQQRAPQAVAADHIHLPTELWVMLARMGLRVAAAAVDSRRRIRPHPHRQIGGRSKIPPQQPENLLEDTLDAVALCFC